MHPIHNEIPYRHMPTFARCAIERLQADNTLRTAPQLDELLTMYAKTYGIAFTPDDGDEHERLHFSAHQHCGRTMPDFMA